MKLFTLRYTSTYMIKFKVTILTKSLSHFIASFIFDRFDRAYKINYCI